MTILSVVLSIIAIIALVVHEIFDVRGNYKITETCKHIILTDLLMMFLIVILYEAEII